MDNSDIISNFEKALKNYNSKKLSALYVTKSEDPSNPNIEELQPIHVLKNISSQIRAIQSADCLDRRSRINNVENPTKTSKFIPVNLKATSEQSKPSTSSSKFETQYVTDTQLINIIEDAEAMMVTQSGVTQEFERTFNHMGEGQNDNIEQNRINFNKVIDGLALGSEDSNSHKCSVKCENNCVRRAEETSTESSNVQKSIKYMARHQTSLSPISESVLNNEQNITLGSLSKQYNSNLKPISIKIPEPDKEEEILLLSPVFNMKQIGNKFKTLPHSFTYNLDLFEKFEALAVPVIENNSDLDTVRRILNSQIITKELTSPIQLNVEDKPTSPIISIDKLKLHTSILKNCDIDYPDEINNCNSPAIKMIIEDDMLFSSDEEITQDQEMPLTCALETSFYKQDVLDKTMYVGFQTASNKSIQISSDSFCRAQNIFNDVNEIDCVDKSKNLTLTELVNVYDSTSKQNVSKKSDCDLNKQILGNDKSLNIENPGSNSFETVNTTLNPISKQESHKLQETFTNKYKNNKVFGDIEKIAINEDSILEEIDHNIISEFENNDMFSNDNLPEICFLTPSNKDNRTMNKVLILDNKDELLKNNKDSISNLAFEPIPIPVGNNWCQIAKPVVGFKTASNKNIKISAESLSKMQNVFKDIDLSCCNDEFTETDTINIEFNSNCVYDQLDSNNSLLGTKTANDELIQISKKSIENKNVFIDFDTDRCLKIDVVPLNQDENRTEITEEIFKCLQLEKVCKVRKAAMSDSMDFKEESHNNELSDSLHNKILCKKFEKPLCITANGYDILHYDDNSNGKARDELSKERLDKGRHSFKDVTVKNDEIIKKQSHGVTNVAFTDITSDEKKDKSEYNLRKVGKIIGDLNNYKITHPVRTEKCNLFIGFKTASNKIVNMSESALMRSKKIFENIDLNEDTEDDNTSNAFQHFNVVKNKIDKVFKQAAIKTMEISEDTNLNDKKETDTCLYSIKTNEAFTGFQTASNKKVKISEDALTKSRRIFDDINLDDVKITDTVTDYTKACESFTNVQKENDMNVRIVDNTFIKNKNILEDIKLTNEKITDKFPQSNEAFIGFQTASNKTVKISEDALLKSRKIFEEIVLAQNKTACQLLDPMSTSNTFEGFQTASNKTVKVSEDALIKSKILSEDIGVNENKITHKLPGYPKTSNAFKGFQTASNKTVKVSEDALVKSKKLFSDITINENKITQKLPEYAKISNAFKGFQTASNKIVKISDDALIKSMKLFEDIGALNNDKISDTLPENAKTCNYFKGFQTSSNNDVKITEDALKKSKRMFEKICLNGNKATDLLSGNLKTSNVFKGLDTANHEKVKISEEVLLKTGKEFKSILPLKKENKTFENYENRMLPKPPFRFSTGNNNEVQVSEEALKKSRQILTKTHQQNKNSTVKHGDNGSEVDINIQSMINTEVMEQFEETLYTEDFLRERTPKNKRSGSPIFSCPRAKIRKKSETPTVKEKDYNRVTSSKYVFEENYKEVKMFRMNHVQEIEKKNKSSKKEIDPYILNFKFDTVLKFEFDGERNEISNNKWTTDNINKCFTDSVNKKIIPDRWICNHIKLIIWKLIAYEISYPNTLHRVCTVKNVLEQLKYRYNRELYKVERPPLRKILEKDEVSNRMIVLRVLSIFVNGEHIDNVGSDSQNIELLLTDGWYCVMGSLDRMLATLVNEKKIVVGMKLVTHGAELMNCEQGISPLKDMSSVRLKLFGNSTRRAHSDARLGFHGNGAILSRLTAVRPEGGKVTRLRVLVTRMYPMLYVEKFEDGSTVTRSERLEMVHQLKYESERQVLLEKIYEEVEKEFADQESQESSRPFPDRKTLDSGSQIWRAMKKNRDPMEYQANLTESQLKELQDYATKRREATLQDLRVRVTDRLKKLGLNVTRNVVTLMKLRVADFDNMKVSKAMLSVWRPSEGLLDVITEGAWIDLFNVFPTAVRYSEMQISAGRQTIFQKAAVKNDEKLLTIAQSLVRKCYSLKELVKNPFTTTEYNEIDTVGFIFLIEPSVKEFESTRQLFQNVYLTDAYKNIICVNFWGGVKKFGFESLLDTGQVVACVNLQKRSGTKKNLLQYRATEFSYFTKISKIESVRKMAAELSQILSTLDRRKLIEDCIYLKNNFAYSKYGNTENVSPYHFNNYNVSKNKIFIDSPVNRDINLNLTGLDFESTFKQTDTEDLSPERLKRKKMVEERIAKLKMYGEPPALSHIHIINKCQNATLPYKSPLISNENVASKDKSPTLCGNNSSPMVNFKKCLKSMNPVKLNFSNAIDEDITKDDPFAEEFDGSPPLSLD